MLDSIFCRRVGMLVIALCLPALANANANANEADNFYGFHATSPVKNAIRQTVKGRDIFRFDTFGDEVFWGDTLRLHEALAGDELGGVGPGVSPATALAVGLKVDRDALPRSLRRDIRRGRVDLDDPATTIALLQLNAVV
ncbi:MAG: hypothetical protein ACR2P1_12795, partial [Pseudomonadales bacterium]